jgi:5-methylcytosine-specific restriction endonuclease McrA
MGQGAAYHRREYQVARRVVLEAAHYRCQWPGCTNVATTVDHVTPLAYGGGNDLANLRASCAPCNSRGGAVVGNELRRGKVIGRRSRHW